MKKITYFIFTVTIGLFTTPVYAADTIQEALKEGKPYVDIRIRHEQVEQTGVANDAKSSTVRTKFGYKSGEYEGFSFGIEAEEVSVLGDSNYNNTFNGQTTFPVVADPDNSIQWNQAFIKYTGIPDSWVKVGRQVMTVDNHRFVGHVGWRQNNQVFDAAILSNSSIEDTTLQYTYIDKVHRIFGEDSPAGDWDSSTHLIHLTNKSFPSIGTLKAYAYWFDFGKDSPANSNKTIGVSLTGKQDISDILEGLSFKYLLEYAHQNDLGDNTTDYNTDYYHIAPALAWKGVTATVGYEVLGSDNGTFGFRTPLATLHKFNGWSDKFLTTPATGLEDFYIELAYKVNGLNDDFSFFNGLVLKGQFHDFSAESGGADYGREWDFLAKKALTKNVTVSVKYSDYQTDGFATDTDKVTFDVNIKF